ncbi:MAG: hypothetical protein AB8C46_10210, partial [Burkholderiaceae bacterium]
MSKVTNGFALFLTLGALAACGGGGENKTDTGSDPTVEDKPITTDCVESVAAGFTDAGSLEGQGDGVGAGASGGGDIGAGGALGRFRSVKVTMQRLNDQSAQAVVGKTDERGFATL